MIATAFGHLFCKSEIVFVEFVDIVSEKNIAGTYFSHPVGYYGVDRY